MNTTVMWDVLSKGLVLSAFLLPVGCNGLAEKEPIDCMQSSLLNVPPSGFNLPSPGDLPRKALADTTIVCGDEYEAGWPSQRVSPGEVDSLVFSPQWDDAAPNTADISYALYSLSTPEPAGYYTVRFDWQDGAQNPDDLWIGLGDFGSSAWDWLRVQSCGVVAFSSDVYVNDSSQIFIAVVCLGKGVWVLQQLTISVNGTIVNGTVAHDEMQREYILYIPASYTGTEAVPLVFNFHGYTGTATSHMEKGDFRALADAAGFLIVHPQGALDVDGKTHWNVDGHGPGSDVDDVGFTTALLDALAADYKIDLARVYATGMSNGGFMSYLLACEMSGQFAAVASVTGTMANSLIDTCNPPVAVPVMEIHGTADSIVPYDGTASLGSIDEVLQYWVAHNHCSTAATITPMPDLDPADGCTAEYVIYEQGDSGATVEHYRIIGGGHTWPGGGYALGAVSRDIDASAKIWEFFSKFDNAGIAE